uniref:non-specific serine/threonine protein kinase n=1 Tax=Sphaeramia orbicularis TaxID=375764 RepID=A0A673BLG7_9TELE
STLASPASQGSPDVYILPLTEVSLPVAKQPGRSVQLLKSSDLGRHHLLYLKEIGNGWFGKVLLGEVNTGLHSTQVVVKELQSGAGVQEQIHFLEEAQPYRLHHPALLQCLAQCTEVSPYLLVMEFCPLGDVKGYLRSCQNADALTPEPLVLQRMACDIASGLLHLHQHNYTHSDLALRNCLLTADVSVKIGDYGLSHTKYKDDYYLTSDQMYVPLRWIAPELVDEVHGNLLVVDQTQQSNIWSLGVTIWELFELGNQPYRHYSDRQVLTYTVREQQLRLPKPQLKLPLAERWYEVMQFCWLQPDQRPNAEEVHLLLSYLCAKGASEAEEDFERRWNSLRPNNGHSGHCGAAAVSRDHTSSTSSSFPLLEQFTAGDGYHSESGDDILTVTETSHGLNFEYKWEQARAEQSLSHGVSPPYYQPKHLHAPSVLPVLSAHSPSVSSEYYIRIEEPVDCSIDPEYTMCSYSPEYQDVYDSNDSSPAISLTMEPLLGQISDSSPLQPWESSHYVSYKDRDGGYYYEHSPPLGLDPYLIGGELDNEHHQESWGSRNLRQALGELESPLGISPSVSSPPKDTDTEEEEEDIFVERHTCNTWPSKHRHRRANHSCRQDAYVDFHYTMPSTDIEDSWPEDHSLAFHSLPKQIDYLEPRQAKDNSACLNLSKHHAVVPPETCNAYIYLCHAGDTQVQVPGECCRSHFVDPLTGLLVRNNSYIHSYSYIRDKDVDIPNNEEMINLSPAPGGPIVPKPAFTKMEDSRDQYADLSCDNKEKHADVVKENLILQKQTEPKVEEVTKNLPPPMDNMHVMMVFTDPQSEMSNTADSGMDQGGSSVNLADILDCSDDDEDEDITDDITDVTSGIFESSEMTASPAFKSLQKQVGTPDSMDSMDLPSAAGSCEGFSPASSHPSSSPKAMDSGYDTENNESPEFVPKEPHESREQIEASDGEPSLGEDLVLGAAKPDEEILLPLSDKTPYRDSAYFSDYENERQSRDDGEEPEKVNDDVEWKEEEEIQDNKDMKLESSSLLEVDGFLIDDTASLAEGGLDEWPSQEENSSLGDWAAEVVGAMEEAIGALNGDSNIRRFSSSSPPPPSTPPPPLPAAEGRASPADGEEADEEDGDTEDSDESDEELRTFSKQEQSGEEDSDDDCHPVPIIVSDNSEAHKLRSLLKMPTLLTSESLEEDLDHKKKTVSFFDDVTVYLFDQESPTKELTEHGFPLGEEGQSSRSKSQERVNASDDSSDGNVSEERYEWEDDFPLLPLPTSSMSSDSPPPRSISKPLDNKPAVQFSRFTISRFSITHISDSDMDSAGGRSCVR